MLQEILYNTVLPSVVTIVSGFITIKLNKLVDLFIEKIKLSVQDNKVSSLLQQELSKLKFEESRTKMINEIILDAVYYAEEQKNKNPNVNKKSVALLYIKDRLFNSEVNYANFPISDALETIVAKNRVDLDKLFKEVKSNKYLKSINEVVNKQ